MVQSSEMTPKQQIPTPAIIDSYLTIYILHIVCIYESAWIKHTHKKSGGQMPFGI